MTQSRLIRYGVARMYTGNKFISTYIRWSEKAQDYVPVTVYSYDFYQNSRVAYK
jgi:hypothetical protein